MRVTRIPKSDYPTNEKERDRFAAKQREFAAVAANFRKPMFGLTPDPTTARVYETMADDYARAVAAYDSGYRPKR